MSVEQVNLSFVVPCFGSEGTIDALFEAIRNVCESHKISYEVVFVDDRGPDQVWNRIQEIKQRYPNNVVAVRFTRNFGQHAATLCGLRVGRGGLLVTIDDDLQIDPKSVLMLLDVQAKNGADLVYGVYPEKKHGFLRNLGSAFVSYAIRKTFRVSNRSSSFRLISKRLVDRLCNHVQPSIFLDGLLYWHASQIESVEVPHHERSVGRSSYSAYKLVAMTARFLFDFTTIPLRAITLAGFTVSILSFGLGVHFLIKWYFYSIPQGFTSIIVTIFFSTGLILMCFGVLGEYFRRILRALSAAPQYSISERL